MTEQVSEVDYKELQNESSNEKLVELASEKTIEKDFSLIKDVEVALTAELGSAEISVETLFNMKKGSVLALDTALDQPVNLYLKGQLVATGNIVSVKDSYGIEIVEIV
jgi:flagellar motor switch protein FliN